MADVKRKSPYRPGWFEILDDDGKGTGSVVCGPCRKSLLAWMEPTPGETVVGDDLLTEAHFKSLGRQPWAGDSRGYRFLQCDECLGRWGPDA